MSRKNDLEQLIRDDYQLVREFEGILQYSENPLEKKRAKDKTAERWQMIHDYLVEYQRICSRLGAALSPDIMELAVVMEAQQSGTQETSKVGKSSELAEQSQLLAGLHQKLTVHFDDNELRTLCLRLDVDYDSLVGEGKAGKARELVTYLQRRERLSEMIAFCRQERPKVSW